MPSHRLYPKAMNSETLYQLRDALLQHHLVGSSPLKGTFESTRGFAVTFTKKGIPDLLKRFPFLSPFLDTVDLDLGMGNLEPWYRRFQAQPIPNAFYMNLLLVPTGAAVGRHIDATLRPQVKIEGLIPMKVSVLWLQVPDEMSGGALNLYRGERWVASIQPREGMLAHFRGELGHEVTEVSAEEGLSPLRASLVCEQYCIPEEAADTLPPLHIKTNAGFQAQLADASEWIDRRSDPGDAL
jgi:hypothetical protein